MSAADWQRYPHVAPWGDPHWFTFPACDGDARRLGVQTYFVDGFLRGARTGTEYAFLTVFTDARILERTHRFSFFSLALFDCTQRRYGTSTDYDFPHLEAAGTEIPARLRGHVLRAHRSGRPGL